MNKIKMSKIKKIMDGLNIRSKTVHLKTSVVIFALTFIRHHIQQLNKSCYFNYKWKICWLTKYISIQFKSIKILQSMFTDESDVHLEIKITKIFRKSPHTYILEIYDALL